MRVGLTSNEYNLAEYLKLKNYTSGKDLNLLELRKQHQKDLKSQEKPWEINIKQTILHQR